MRISHLVIGSILIAMGFDVAVLAQVETMRNGAAAMGDGKCMQSTSRPLSKYSIVSVEFGLISRIPKRLAVKKSLNPECGPRSEKTPDRELKFLVRPRALARLRTT
jgi:hypothetical protein